MTREEHRQPVPDGPDAEWQKFSAQNETGVEAERGKIRAEEKQPTAAAIEFQREMDALAKQPEMNYHTKQSPEELLQRVESGELTYEELDQQVLAAYRETPASERNWRRDAGFYQLPEEERRQELVQEAIRDTLALSETLRAALSDSKTQRRLRDMLTEIGLELQRHI